MNVWRVVDACLISILKFWGQCKHRAYKYEYQVKQSDTIQGEEMESESISKHWFRFYLILILPAEPKSPCSKRRKRRRLRKSIGALFSISSASSECWCLWCLCPKFGLEEWSSSSLHPCFLITKALKVSPAPPLSHGSSIVDWWWCH